jgi:uncharacterized membrane protein YqaE (UPF0057 family)
MTLGFNGFLNKALFPRLGWIIFLPPNGLGLDKGPTTSVLFTIYLFFFGKIFIQDFDRLLKR